MAQGSPEWFAARMGIPTASNFHRIITAKTLKPSAQAPRYRNELLAERLFGTPVVTDSSPWMERGSELEASAIAYYELQQGIDTDPVGFVLRDDRRVGASPDRLCGTEGVLEIKVPGAAIHIGHLLANGLEDDHRCQVQGQLWVCERRWADVLSFNPLLPPAMVRVQRNEEFIQALSDCMEAFLDDLEWSWQKLSKLVGAGEVTGSPSGFAATVDPAPTFQ